MPDIIAKNFLISFMILSPPKIFSFRRCYYLVRTKTNFPSRVLNPKMQTGTRQIDEPRYNAHSEQSFSKEIFTTWCIILEKYLDVFLLHKLEQALS
jgi:hypothetical protein